MSDFSTQQDAVCNELESYLAPFAPDELSDRTADIAKLKEAK